MNDNQNLDKTYEEVETELKETAIPHFWGKDAEKVAELDKQGKVKWRPYTEQEQEKLEQKLDHFNYLNSLVRKPILALEEGTGLTPEEAKTVVYWTVATHGLDVLNTFPPLVLHGQKETGKSFTLETIATLVGLTKDDFISVTTPAAFRDQLMKCHVALIEEGDKVNEDLILKRYSKQSGTVHIKAPTNFGFVPVSGSIYGATALHKRYSFEDLALESRCITIETKEDKLRRDTIGFSTIPLGDADKDGLKELCEDAWSRFSHYHVLGRTANNWRPLIIVALALGDLDWVRYANKMQMLSKEELTEDGEFEPEQLVAHAVDYLNDSITKFIPLSEIIRHLDSTYMYKPSAKRTAKILRGLGYTVEHHREGFAIEL